MVVIFRVGVIPDFQLVFGMSAVESSQVLIVVDLDQTVDGGRNLEVATLVENVVLGDL